jgi:hypothetical protein
VAAHLVRLAGSKMFPQFFELLLQVTATSKMFVRESVGNWIVYPARYDVSGSPPTCSNETALGSGMQVLGATRMGI